MTRPRTDATIPDHAIVDNEGRRIAWPVTSMPGIACPSVHRLVYTTHPFSPSCFTGTPAAGRVPGRDRMAWLAEDYWGNPIGVEEADWLPLPMPHGARATFGDLSVRVSAPRVVWERRQQCWTYVYNVEVLT